MHDETRRGHAVICGEFSAGGPQRQVQQELQPEPILADARDRRVAQRQAAPESSIACARDTPQTTGAARSSTAAGFPYDRGAVQRIPVARRATGRCQWLPQPLDRAVPVLHSAAVGLALGGRVPLEAKLVLTAAAAV